MKINSKLPKTFVIFIKTDHEEGYLKYHANQLNVGEIFFSITLEKNQKNASKFVNFNNVKKIAKDYSRIKKCTEIKIIDEKLKKHIRIKF